MRKKTKKEEGNKVEEVKKSEIKEKEEEKM